jgi:AcrR family transcriptional regulator
MRKEDMRKIRTKRALKEAIAKLLENNSIDKISVIDICEEANINRVTFYTHYKDKLELIHELFIDVLKLIESRSIEYYEQHKTGDEIHDFTSTMAHVTYKTCIENKKFILSLTKEENLVFAQMLSNIITKNGINMLAHSTNKINLKYPPDFIIKFILGGFSSLIFEWALKKDELTEAEFFKYYDKLFYSLLRNKIFFDYK